MRAAMNNTILLDGLAAWTGGQVTRLRAFLQRFRQYDPDSRLVVLEENGNAASLCPGRADIEFVNVENRLPAGYARALKRFAWQNTRLPPLARSLGANVYLSFSHDLPPRLPREVRSIIGVANLAPFSKEARDAEVRFGARLRLTLLRRRILSSCRRAGRVIALSETCRSILTGHGVDAAKVVVIPNGVEPAHEPPRPVQDAQLAAWGIQRPYLLYVSHFYRYKNFERLVAAYASLPPATRGAYDLVLAGAPHDGDYCAEIRELARRRGVAERVRIIPGAKDDGLAALYLRCALFVFPSLIENSPNILLEAMAAGAPVLAGAIAPMPEFGADAVGYFDPLSGASMADAIARALADAPQLAAMREKGRARAALYSWDEFTRRAVGLYRGLP
jgi:glycosyltransferase involved in cell wall biosynthesis